ncbi:hypothetical protein M407DRAFT_7982 [Tulasnella calospora MUT 4182]|uniref:Uncharacterized protein n=1 Tax=Tulasnella calospora MUT 4182 TaxID=1051891 RepID=A0A0C3LXK2_9AGAM|nr:hypothetical protein M407DRAFT_7982 [Tulasnella calospora MUT 4182]
MTSGLSTGEIPPRSRYRFQPYTLHREYPNNQSGADTTNQPPSSDDEVEGHLEAHAEESAETPTPSPSSSDDEVTDRACSAGKQPRRMALSTFQFSDSEGGSDSEIYGPIELAQGSNPSTNNSRSTPTLSRQEEIQWKIIRALPLDDYISIEPINNMSPEADFQMVINMVQELPPRHWKGYLWGVCGTEDKADEVMEEIKRAIFEAKELASLDDDTFAI